MKAMRSPYTGSGVVKLLFFQNTHNYIVQGVESFVDRLTTQNEPPTAFCRRIMPLGANATWTKLNIAADDFDFYFFVP